MEESVELVEGEGATTRPTKKRKEKKDPRVLHWTPLKKPRPDLPDDPTHPSSKRLPKKKVALLLGYIGTGYHGIQRNPGVKSIEVDLEKAIVSAGGIHDFNTGSFTKVRWERCARTDKGVHAITNVISLNMVTAIPDILLKINNELPAQIRLFEIKQVTSSFGAKNLADSRIYEYLLPSYVLTAFSTTEALPPTDLEAVPPLPTNPVTEEMLKSVNEYLEVYQGTHNYFNYTSGKKMDEKSARRHIISCRCEGPVQIGEQIFIRFIIHGQSFMIHQIRKMIGLVVLLHCKGVDKSVMLETFKQKLSIPRAPAEGLMLQKCLFAAYERTRGKDLPSLACSDTQAVDDFRLHVVYPHIAANERDTKRFYRWWHEMQYWWRDVAGSSTVAAWLRNELPSVYNTEQTEGEP